VLFDKNYLRNLYQKCYPIKRFIVSKKTGRIRHMEQASFMELLFDPKRRLVAEFLINLRLKNEL
jgi:hypothetical protein